MARQTSMLHLRVDDKLKTAAAETLANFGLTVSDAVRILLTRVAKEGALPAGLTADPKPTTHGFEQRCGRRWRTSVQRFAMSRSCMTRRH